MYVLGLSCNYHDGSAALLYDGVCVAAAAQERFSGKKHDAAFPLDAVKYCLVSQGIDIDDIDAVCFYEQPVQKFERLCAQYIHKPPTLREFSKVFGSWVGTQTFRDTYHRYKDLQFGNLYIASQIRKVLNYTGKIYYCTHHQSHAASAYYASGFGRSALLTIDGVGEWSTLTMGIGEGRTLDLRKEIRFPHSLGLLYSTITAYLGFKVNNGEYKVMGLSAYGQKDKQKNEYYKKLAKTIDVKPDGGFLLDMSYFDFVHSDRMPSEKLCALLDGPVSRPNALPTQRHKDIAAALQIITEETIFKILHTLHKETQCDVLCYAGGVALNSVANGKILENTPFKEIFIPPAAGDAGASLGAAYYCYHQILGNDRKKQQTSAYLGPSYDNELFKFYLDFNDVAHVTYTDELLVQKVAQLISENFIVAWFSGRMEWGPRALGNRSLLANPLNPDMQRLLNKIKRRESFRPFAPSVCRDDASTYFELPDPCPHITDYMLMVYPVRHAYRKILPAITHVDGTARLQTVRHEVHPLYYDVIKAFGKISGVPMVINTSFNIRGEPIVCTPDDAYKCFLQTPIDYLVLGNYVVKK